AVALEACQVWVVCPAWAVALEACPGWVENRAWVVAVVREPPLAELVKAPKVDFPVLEERVEVPVVQPLLLAQAM
ncbi:MAG: hypothetical protein DWH88_03680, partial [Planctomycetota bacterium]